MNNTGKDISSRNAIKHGCCSLATLILPAENLADFQSLEAAWLTSYAPLDGAETHLVHQLVIADWLRQRATRTLAEIEAQIFAAQPNPLEWTDAHHLALTRFQRYQTTNTNNVAKNRKALDDYRRHRTTESHRTEKLTIAKTRLKIHEQKNKPLKSFEEALQITRERNLRLGYIQADPPQL